MQSPDLKNLDTESLKPGEQPVQRSLIPQRAMHDRLNRLDGCGKPFEVEQNLGWEGPGHPDLIVGRWHRSPSLVGIFTARHSLRSLLAGIARSIHGG
jgi:hypothetical protein